MTDIAMRVMRLTEERAALIYGFDKVSPENRERYDDIQQELANISMAYEKLLEFVKKCSLPDHKEEFLQEVVLCDNLTKQMIAMHALEARKLLNEIGEDL